MPIIETNLRNTRESARQIRFEQTLTIPATDVQDAIQQVNQLIAPIPIPVNSGMSPYTPLPNDLMLLVDTSGGPVTILMPSAIQRGLPLEIKDDTGNADANNISITFTGGETLDGLAPYKIDSKFGAVTLAPQIGGYYAK